MIPGISAAADQRLVRLLSPAVTGLTEEVLGRRDMTILDAAEPDARHLGVQFGGGPPATIVVTDRTRPLGQVRLQTAAPDVTLFFDNRGWVGHFHAAIRVLGVDSVLAFGDIGDAYVVLPDILLRSTGQVMFWGEGASSVGCSIEIEGEGCGVAVGDDALVSSGVWIRNHDMHAIVDVATGAVIGRPPVDTVIERHVWLGQDALVLGCERIGSGAIIGARALVKGLVPPCAVAAGVPARVLREGVSWGRSVTGMTAAERVAVGLPPMPARR